MRKTTDIIMTFIRHRSEISEIKNPSITEVVEGFFFKRENNIYLRVVSNTNSQHYFFIVEMDFLSADYLIVFVAFPCY